MSRGGGRSTHAQARIEEARQRYNLAFHSAARASLREAIAELLKARQQHALSDEAFGKLIEILLAGYVESEVSAQVEGLLGSLPTDAGPIHPK